MLWFTAQGREIPCLHTASFDLQGMQHELRWLAVEYLHPTEKQLIPTSKHQGHQGAR